MSRRLEIFLVVSLVLAGAGLRLYGLTSWPWDSGELATLNEVNRETQGLEQAHDLATSRATLWAMSLVAHHLQPAPLALRMIPCLLSMVLLIALYRPVKRLWSTEVSLIWLSTIAFSPLAVHAASYASYHSFLLTFGAFTIVLTLDASTKKRGRTLVFASLYLLLASAFHLSALLLLPPFLLIIVLLPALQRRSAPAWVSLFILATALTITALALRHSLPLALDDVIHSLRIHEIRYAPWHLLGSLFFQIGPGICLFALFGTYLAFKGSSVAPRLLALFAAIPVLTLFFASFAFAIGPRYGYAAVPAFYLLAAYGAGHLVRGLPASAYGGRLAILGIILAPQLPSLASNLISENSRYDIRPFTYALREGRLGSAEQLERDIVVAESHAVFSHYTRLQSIELPWTIEQLRPLVEGKNRVFLITHYQRGKLVGVTDPDLQDYLDRHCFLCGREVSRRFDLYRFEVRLYCNRPAEETFLSAQFLKKL